MKWGILSLQCFQFGGDGQAQLFGLDDGAQHIQKAVVTAAVPDGAYRYTKACQPLGGVVAADTQVVVLSGHDDRFRELLQLLIGGKDSRHQRVV